MSDKYPYRKHGKNYRVVGGVIEYEPEVLVGGRFVAESQAEKVKASHKDVIYNLIEKEKQEALEREKLPQGYCPIVFRHNQTHAICNKNCAFLDNYSCKLRMLDTGEELYTTGKKCPIDGRMCNHKCVFNVEGCIFLKRINKEIEEYGQKTVL